MTPSAFIFLYENQLFLTFRNRTVVVWNFRGELVTSFEDHLLWHPDCNTNNIYITSDQDLIISYCKSHPHECTEEERGIGRRYVIHSFIPMCSWCSNSSKYIYFLMCFCDGHFALVYAKVTPIVKKFTQFDNSRRCSMSLVCRRGFLSFSYMYWVLLQLDQ